MLVFTSTVAPNLNTGDEFSRFSGSADIAASPAWYNFCLLVRSSHCSTVALTPAISSAPPRHKGHSYQYGPCLCDCCKRGLAHASCIFFSTNLAPGNSPQLHSWSSRRGAPLHLLRGFPDVRMRNAYFTAAALGCLPQVTRWKMILEA